MHEKSGAKFAKKLFFWHRLAASGVGKQQQHIDGKPDGEFSAESYPRMSATFLFSHLFLITS
jgi:hypothetical protein